MPIRFFGWQVLAVRLFGLLLAVGGVALIIEVIPTQFLFLILGLAMIFAGWTLFKYCS